MSNESRSITQALASHIFNLKVFFLGCKRICRACDSHFKYPFYKAMKLPKETKKRKNVRDDELFGQIGRLWVPDQDKDLGTIGVTKGKGAKRTRRAAAAAAAEEDSDE